MRELIRIRHNRIYQLLEGRQIHPPPVNETISVRRVTSADVDRAADFRTEQHVENFRRFLQEGQWGVYAWREEKVVGHAWAVMCRQGSCRVNGYMDLGAGEAFMHYCSVRESCRGWGVYSLMLLTLCNMLMAEAGVHRAVIDSAVGNRASLRGIEKAGFEPVGTALFVHVLGKRVLKLILPARTRAYSRRRRV